MHTKSLVASSLALFGAVTATPLAWRPGNYHHYPFHTSAESSTSATSVSPAETSSAAAVSAVTGPAPSSSVQEAAPYPSSAATSAGSSGVSSYGTTIGPVSTGPVGTGSSAAPTTVAAAYSSQPFSSSSAVPVSSSTSSSLVEYTASSSTAAAATTSNVTSVSSSSATAASATSEAPAPTSGSSGHSTNPDSADNAFAAKGKRYFGTIYDTSSPEEAKDNIDQYWGALTPEFSMKWGAIESVRGSPDYSGGDYVVALAEEQGKLVRGHNLIWHQAEDQAEALPAWVSAITDKTELTEAIEKHVTEVVGHWKGKIYAWDVVNEIFNDDGTLRDSVFSRVLGEDFVRIAFEAARAADPNAKLYINDYTLDDANSPKVITLISKVKEWIAAGIPIDGVGSQSHLYDDASKTPAAMAAICGAASECAITELDIKDATQVGYDNAIKACLDLDNCVGVSTWGIRDQDSWRKDEGTEILLFDANFQPKPVYSGLVDYIKNYSK